MAQNKKAYLVDVDLVIRLIMDDKLDPAIDYKDFDKAIYKAIKSRMEEEGMSFITEGITDVEEDESCPYDPEYDD
jgi:hypothetical protein